jgi:hypothetical protein
MLTNQQVQEIADKFNQEMQAAGIQRFALVVLPSANLARCHFCRKEGIYGKDIIDEDFLDSTGHDSTVTACREIQACLSRQYGIIAS